MNEQVAIIAYIIFRSSAEFVAWQQKEKRSIYSVSPLHIGNELGLKVISKTDDWIGDVTPSFGVFVTYAADGPTQDEIPQP